VTGDPAVQRDPAVQPPAPADVDRLLERLRLRRDRLILAAGAADTDALARAVDEVGEDLLVADEELRVQTEQLSRSTLQLDALVSAYEELFANAATAYVQTDADGLILRVNRVAARLLAITPVARSRTLPGALRLQDRPAVRRALTRLRAANGRSTATTHEPIEAAILRPDGSELSVVLRARRSRDGETGQVTVHWEMEERGAELGPQADRRADISLAATLAEAVADLARQVDPALVLTAAAEWARRLVPSAAHVGVVVTRTSGGVKASAATGELARAADAAQVAAGEGPLLAARRAVTPVLVADLPRDPRWPRLAHRAATGSVHAALAAPLVGQRGCFGAITAYAERPEVFSDDDAQLLTALAAQTGVVYTFTDLELNLRQGMTTREMVGRAVGILMERHRLTAEKAFDLLVAVSQESHRKLRDVAALVSDTGEDPRAI
jgi:PAS domain-containing protein